MKGAGMRTRKEKYSKFSLLTGAAWIAIGGFVAKILGALYRIPLTDLIGGHGIGLYQLVYPVYCLLLTVSATGIPSSIAKLTAERVKDGQPTADVLKTAMRLFLIIGLFGSVLMAIIAPALSTAQGSREVLNGYYALAPSVFFVSAISVFRGWFQGQNKMQPTAFSEITEQAVKVALGLYFANRFQNNIQKAVVYLLLAVTLSEIAALLLLWWIYRRQNRKKQRQKCKECRKNQKTQQNPAPVEQENTASRGLTKPITAKTILKLSIPVTFSAILLPLSALLDSVLAPRLLSAYTTDAVTLFGLFAGGAVTIVGLPVSVCYGIAAASVPAVASSKQPRKKLFFSLAVTAAVGLPSAVGLYLFANPAVKMIFRSLSGEELATLVKLVKIFSISALTLSCVQTLSACLTAQGKPQYAALSMLIAVTIKTAVYVTLLQDPRFSIFGMAHATNICYLVAFFLNLLYNLRVSKKDNKKLQ